MASVPHSEKCLSRARQFSPFALKRVRNRTDSSTHTELRWKNLASRHSFQQVAFAIMMQSAIESFLENRKDVDRLLEIHQDVGGAARGRKWGVEVLNKAAIVLTCAIWEAFAEDLVAEGIEHLATQLKDPQKLPKAVRQEIAKGIKADRNELSPWTLADTGWQAVLRANAASIVSTTAGKLNTPKSSQLRGMYSKTLGIGDVTAYWARPKLKPVDAASRLDAFITLRGAIAHRGQAASSVTKQKAVDFLALVANLVELTDAGVRSHLKGVTGQDMPRIVPV